MPRTPTDDMAAAIGKVVAHDAPPLILARAGADGRPNKLPLALACEQLARMAGIVMRLTTRVSALERQPVSALEARLDIAERRIADLEAADRRPDARRLILP
jgi:hypothetical protein